MGHLGVNPDLRDLEDGLAEAAQLTGNFPELQSDRFRPHIFVLSYSYRRISKFLQQNMDPSSTITPRIVAKQVEAGMAQSSREITAGGLTGMLSRCDLNGALWCELRAGSKVIQG
jgi:hypothetical protein